MLVTTLVALISSVQRDQQAVVTSASFAFRATGSSLGVAACIAAFQNTLRVRLETALLGNAEAGELLQKITRNLDYIRELDPTIRAKVRDGLISAVGNAFLLTLIFSIAAGASALAMKQNQLHMNLARK